MVKRTSLTNTATSSAFSRSRRALSPAIEACELTSQRKSQNRHRAALANSDRIIRERHVFYSLSQDFDPLDREILEQAFDVAWATVKETERLVAGFDNDDNLTAALRSNLIEIAQTKRFGDAEALLDALLDRLRPTKL
jgi:hypothetical protein